MLLFLFGNNNISDNNAQTKEKNQSQSELFNDYDSKPKTPR